MKRHLTTTCALALVLCAGGAAAQLKATAQNVPEIPVTSVPNFLKPPPNEYFGESVAVATNSKGHVFVYMRSANTRLWEFDQNGNFVKEIGKGITALRSPIRCRLTRRPNSRTSMKATT